MERAKKLGAWPSNRHDARLLIPKFMVRAFLLFTVVGALAIASASAAENELTPEEKKAGWKLLFDGETTKGWRSFKKETFPEKGWIVKDGELQLQPRSRAGDIITTEKFSDFDLTWEWKLPKGANNGLKYFILEERGGAIGHEYQMLDDKGKRTAGTEDGTASFYEVLAPDSIPALKPAGEWNHSRVLVQGNHVEHWLNGRKVLEYELGSEHVLKAVQDSKFKDVPGFGEKQNGHILLTYHNDPVSYRNIKIRRLSGSPSAAK